MPTAASSNVPLPGSTALREQHRPLATYHATLLQQRKDIELQILSSIETFLDFPTSSEIAAHPSQSDIAAFRSQSRLFQVSDYDDLLLERNLAEKCGYVFCPLPFREEGGIGGGGHGGGSGRKIGKFQLLPGGQVMKMDDVRKFCGKGCARRAMFVKVQLSEVPAWERRGGQGKGGQVEVLTGEIDGKGGEVDSVKRRIDDLAMGNEDGQTGEEETVRKQMDDLAVERGEVSTNMRQQDLLQEGIVEKEARRPSRPPDASNVRANVGLSIEGYAPRKLPNRSRRKQTEVDGEGDAVDLP